MVIKQERITNVQSVKMLNVSVVALNVNVVALKVVMLVYHYVKLTKTNLEKIIVSALINPHIPIKSDASIH